MTPLEANIQQLESVARSLTQLECSLAKAVDVVRACLAGGHKLLVCGNGGSAADASHLATEFVSRFNNERRPYPAIALNDLGSTLTAIGNDYAFEEIFARQVWGFGQPGDVLIAFSTSGRSPNIVRALKEAASRDLTSIAFLGKDGGSAKGLATVELIVASESTARIQEAHQMLLHTLCEMVEVGL